MPTGLGGESDATAVRKTELIDKVALVGGTARVAVIEHDEIEHALEELPKVVNKALQDCGKALQDCGKALEIYNGLLAVMKKKTPKEYGEYLQKKRQGKRRYK